MSFRTQPTNRKKDQNHSKREKIKNPPKNHIGKTKKNKRGVSLFFVHGVQNRTVENKRAHTKIGRCSPLSLSLPVFFSFLFLLSAKTKHKRKDSEVGVGIGSISRSGLCASLSRPLLSFFVCVFLLQSTCFGLLMAFCFEFLFTLIYINMLYIVVLINNNYGKQ